MCGIVGTLGTPEDSLAVAMNRALHHRGPDETGIHTGHRVHLGAQRLSIIDVAGGRQPIYDETGEICVVANCEIYNHRELAADLVARGHRFTTGSDVEVIVHLFEEHGERCVEYLTGMFAFAVAHPGGLFLARDGLGIKPLYYSEIPDAGRFLFASEIKALLACPDLRPTLDLQAFTDGVVLGYETGDRTLLSDVRCLPPGHTMTVCENRTGLAITRRRYHPRTRPPEEEMSIDDATDRLVELLRDTVRSHLAADVEVGLLLSGGVDSTLLAAFMREITEAPFRTFTVADSTEHPDAVQASRVAEWLRCPHETVLVTFTDFVASVPGYVLAAERTPLLGSVPLYVLCRRLGGDLKVCLNGEGADEVFGGYPEYRVSGHGAAWLAGRVAAVRAIGLEPSPRVMEIVEGREPGDNRGGYLRRTFAENMREQLTRRHLEPLDSCSMAFGIEMRVPYLDRHVVDFVASLPVEFLVDDRLGVQKYLLRRAALTAYGHLRPMADAVLRRKLGAPTVAARFLSRLDEQCDRLLPDDYLTRHELGRCLDTKRELLMLELFEEIMINNRGSVPAGLDIPSFVRDRAGVVRAPG